ncbi:riboflavin transporter 2-like [Latimeria chalumnae]|uniref:Riboflavin transporter n=1 Tax=Latimeria chalumnae TaxID=7897 RepID=H3A9V2_LATCH|nr:PREDICTED: riboflavin transporter 2-like [Latimeria chalumnae]|eukprot:XP_006011166.1 PREDICTED: riboflavin transporter 2-like [Latimeria chalumnae]
MALIVHVLACLFGMGSWVAINGIWVELPLMVFEIPEGWYLPSYITILIQLANTGPLFVTLMHKFYPGRLKEVGVIYVIICIGILACFLLALFWNVTAFVAGVPRSVALLILMFFLSIVDCTSSVTFLPFMMRLKAQYLTTYFIGEGLSGLVPAAVALIQGVGIATCVNRSLSTVGADLNLTVEELGLVAEYQPANFSVRVFFFFLSAMMAVCLVSFILLNHLPAVHRQRSRKEEYKLQEALAKGEKETQEQKLMMNLTKSQKGTLRNTFGTGRYSWGQIVFIFVVLAWVNGLTNAVLPSVQSYSCLPYGNLAYHLSATLGAVANPLACFIAMFLPNRSLLLMGLLTLAGSGIGSYITAMAVLSPCPLLVHSDTGVVLIVLCWVLFVGTLSYVKVMIGVILRDEGHSALVWCGAVVQLGSMLGALTMFPLVGVYNLFRSGDPCNTRCPM